MTAQERATFDIAARKQWNLRGLSVLSFAHGANDLFSGMVPLLIFTVVAAHGLSPVYQGFIGFLWYLTSSIVQPLFGLYSDARGRWWFLPAGVLLGVAGVSFAGLAPTVALLGLMIVIGGIGSAVMHPEAGKYSAMLSGSRKGGGISIFQIGGALGFALGPIVISHLIDRFGARGSVVMLAPGLLAAAFLFATMRRVDFAAVRHHGTENNAGAATQTVVDRPGVSLLVASTAFRYLVTAAFMTYLPNLVAVRGGSIVAAGEIVTAFLAVGAIGLFAGGYLGDRFGALRVSIVSLLLAVPCLYGFFIENNAFGMASLLLASVLLNVQSAPGVVIVQRMLPRNLGMALGLMNGVAFGIGSALVAIAGFVVASGGPQLALELVSLLPVLCALAYVVVAIRGPKALSNA
ncbi:MAG: MFS transporter [Candidatus Eremiobacteraeota bacterium]|nr:MFS transporter [Candidatus Eremiobacteraeota bacterium]